MPVLGITTPMEFTGTEWDKLARAWHALSPTEKELKAREKVDQLRRDGKLDLYPALPGWDDFLQTGRVPAHLTLAEFKAKKRATAARIRGSPTPASVQGLGGLLNAIDDIEDIVSMVGLGARLAIRAAPRVLGRAVPVLSVIITATDVLNFLSLLTVGGMVLLGLKAEGPLGAAAQLAGPVFTKALLKSELWKLLRLNRGKTVRPNALSLRLASIFEKDKTLPRGVAQTWGKLIGKRIGVGEILEAAQATDTLTGYGISLGAFMGYIQDWSWAIYRNIVRPSVDQTVEIFKATKAGIEPEWLIRDTPDTIELSALQGQSGRGPAWAAWQNTIGHIDGGETALGAFSTINQPGENYCYIAKWIHHPRYPREPDSIVLWRVRAQVPSHLSIVGANSALSTYGAVLFGKLVPADT